jgi:aconitate hydratase
VRVRDVAGADIYQAYIGSSANPGFRDYAVAAAMVRGRKAHDRVSFDINPTSQQTLQSLVAEGQLANLIAAGARIHQSGCNGCIGMGQAPAVGRISLRTVPRNFPGRSGTREDNVYLCSPETAAASALTGVITDPRDLGLTHVRIAEPEHMAAGTMLFVPPAEPAQARATRLEKTPNITTLPDFERFRADVSAAVLLKVGDDVSTDGIIPPGTRLPYWSNIPRVAEFAFEGIDGAYAVRARERRERGERHVIVAGANYGQGSSRENAAIAPRYLGLEAVIARSFARIHWQNLVNFGVLPLTFADPADYDRLDIGDTIRLPDVAAVLRARREFDAEVAGSGRTIRVRHTLSERQIDILLAGGAINWRRERRRSGNGGSEEGERS